MAEATAEMASRIQQALPHLAHGTLRFFGDWFGRPWDNDHQVVHARSTVDTLVLRLDGDETLTVWNPAGLTATESALRIEVAARVRFEWFWYGRPMTPENLVYVDYTFNGEEVDFDTDIMPDRFEPHTDPAAPAVEMLSIEEHFEEAR
jgi:hypothetical protein